jgi:mercuric ion transport protein
MSMTNRQWFRTGVVSSVLLALCCVTPILFIAITAVGLSAGWLDFVLIPALVVSMVLTYWAWRRCREDDACAVDARHGAQTKESTP